MPLSIHNTLTRKKEPFVPLEPGKVRMYACGPTVYDEPHIGHLRSAYVFDVIRNILQHSGLKVRFVRNVTDVDDKIIQKARGEGLSDLRTAVKNVSDRYYELYAADLATLGVKPPDEEPRATRYISGMTAMIQALIDKGSAYVTDDGVYFSIDTFKSYGKLSGQRKEAMLEAVRIDPLESKRSPLDFALWKRAKEEEPSWPSPWGNGRPAWHIECSAMNLQCHGERIDIHGGGRDLIFPHHENEIAQTESLTSQPFANYWIHHGLVTVNGQKMSKSLKNYTTLGQIAASNPKGAEELKFLFLASHYSAPVDYSDKQMQMQKSVRARFIEFIMKAEGFNEKQVKSKPEFIQSAKNEVAPFQASFDAALYDDFNTPQALAVMHDLVSHVNRKWSESTALINEGRKLLLSFFDILGLNYKDAYPDPGTVKLSSEVAALIHERETAKINKDYQKADRLRQEILDRYQLRLIDEKDGSTRWLIA